MRKPVLRFSVVLIMLTALFVTGIGYARAESVLWSSTNIPDLKYLYSASDIYSTNNAGTKGKGWYDVNQTLKDIQVSVRYNVAVYQLDGTGGKIQPLASGATVPNGTRVLYEFVPHQYSDITWNGTGSYSDTPYGTWSANAQLPGAPFNVCGGLAGNKEGLRTHHLYKEGSRNLYAVLAGAPPQKNLNFSGVSASCTPWQDGVSQVCTLSETGTRQAQFVFDNTVGNFFTSIKHTHKSKFFVPEENDNGYECEVTASRPMYTSSVSSPYSVSIPSQSIPHSLTVLPPDSTANPPAAPNVSPTGSCVAGDAFTISFTSTDPEGDQIRYGIDWDTDGSVDQWAPPTGYVASGVTQQASRTYATAGTKTVQVLAQDIGGLTSSWTTTSFSCAPGSATVGLNEGSTENGDGSGNGTFFPSAPDLNLRAVPSLVRRDATTQVNWSATNVESCTVTSTNGDTWDGIESAIGGETSSPIQGQTTYTLTCLDDVGNSYFDQAVVNIIPGFEEL